MAGCGGGWGGCYLCDSLRRLPTQGPALRPPSPFLPQVASLLLLGGVAVSLLQILCVLYFGGGYGNGVLQLSSAVGIYLLGGTLMGFYKQGRRGPKFQGLKSPFERKPRHPTGKHSFSMGLDCSLYSLMFTMAINNCLNWRVMTELTCTCLVQVLRNPSPKMATMHLVGIRTSQVRVKGP